MTMIDTDIQIARYKEIKRKVVRQAIRENADEEDCKYTFKDVYKDAYINVEDRGYIDEVIRDDDNKKHNNILFSIAFVMISTITPIAGCIMWFTSVRLWINITILALAGIVCQVFIKIDEPRESSKKRGIVIVTDILECMSGVFVYPIITAIIVAVIEGFLWIGSWIF